MKLNDSTDNLEFNKSMSFIDSEVSKPLRLNDDTYDLEIIVQDQSIKCHVAVVTKLPYFQAMKETHAKVITIADQSYDTVFKLITILYEGINSHLLDNMSTSQMAKLVMLADQWGYLDFIMYVNTYLPKRLSDFTVIKLLKYLIHLPDDFKDTIKDYIVTHPVFYLESILDLNLSQIDQLCSVYPGLPLILLGLLKWTSVSSSRVDYMEHEIDKLDVHQICITRSSLLNDICKLSSTMGSIKLLSKLIQHVQPLLMLRRKYDDIDGQVVSLDDFDPKYLMFDEKPKVIY